MKKKYSRKRKKRQKKTRRLRRRKISRKRSRRRRSRIMFGGVEKWWLPPEEERTELTKSDGKGGQLYGPRNKKGDGLIYPHFHQFGTGRVDFHPSSGGKGTYHLILAHGMYDKEVMRRLLNDMNTPKFAKHIAWLKPVLDKIIKNGKAMSAGLGNNTGNKTQRHKTPGQINRRQKLREKMIQRMLRKEWAMMPRARL